MSNNTQSAEHNDFWNHRSFKIIVGYLVGSWTLLEFLNFTLERLQISPYWTEIFLYSLLLFLPALLTIVFIPKNQDKKFPRIFRKYFPVLNVIAILITIYLLFSGKALGAMTEEVTYVDENGAYHKANMVKGAFMKSIIFHKLQVEGEIDSLDQWLATGIPKAVEMNFRQFQGVQLWSDSTDKSLKEKLEALSGTTDYIVTGSFSSQKEKLSVNLKFYSSKGKINESRIEVKNLFTLSDDIKHLILNITKPVLAKGHIDLPFVEFVTNNIEAFRYFNNKDYQKAYETDPYFAYAYLVFLEQLYYFSLNNNLAIALANKAMQKVGQLPEFDQLLLKALYFLINNQDEKGKNLLETYLKLNSQDVKSQELYINILANLGQDQKAIDYFSNHYQAENARLPLELMMANGQTEKARFLIDKMGELNTDFDQYLYIGQFNLIEKKYDAALGYFEKAKLEKPLASNIDSMIKVTKFMKGMGIEGLRWFGTKAKGLYKNENGEQPYTIDFINDHLTTKNVNQNRARIYLLDSFNFVHILPSGIIINRFNCNSTGNWNYLKYMYKPNSGKQTITYDYRVTNEIALGFKYFEDEHYGQADSLFKKVYGYDSNYYFLKNYRVAIAHMSLPRANRLPFQSAKTFIVSGNKVYVEPHINYLKTGSRIDMSGFSKTYPTGNGWAINFRQKNLKLRFVLTETGWIINVHKYDHDLRAYKKIRTYKEVK